MKGKLFLFSSFLSIFLILMTTAIPAFQYNMIQKNIQSEINNLYGIKLKTKNNLMNIFVNKWKPREWNPIQIFFLLCLIVSSIFTVHGFKEMMQFLIQGDIINAKYSLMGALIWLYDAIMAYFGYNLVSPRDVWQILALYDLICLSLSLLWSLQLLFQGNLLYAAKFFACAIVWLIFLGQAISFREDYKTTINPTLS